MREVYNYRKALREPKKIKQITDNYYLPFSIELLPAVNFMIFLILTLVIGYFVRKVYPNAFSNTWFIFIVGLPLFLTWLTNKIKPEGKNIYRFIYDYFMYLVMIKIPKKRFCCGEEVRNMYSNITFKQCVGVYNKNEDKISIENDKRQHVINENGRRIRVLSNKKRINFDSESENDRAI